MQVHLPYLVLNCMCHWVHVSKTSSCWIVKAYQQGAHGSERNRKDFFATDRTDIHTLEEAIKGADVFLGLSKGNVLSQDMVRSMAPMPIVFALANPTPEISYEDAMAARPDVLMVPDVPTIRTRLIM